MEGTEYKHLQNIAEKLNRAQTVGELRSVLAQLPDSLPVNFDVNSAYVTSAYTTTNEIKDVELVISDM